MLMPTNVLSGLGQAQINAYHEIKAQEARDIHKSCMEPGSIRFLDERFHTEQGDAYSGFSKKALKEGEWVASEDFGINIKKLSFREELQKEVDEWLGD